MHYIDISWSEDRLSDLDLRQHNLKKASILNGQLMCHVLQYYYQVKNSINIEKPILWMKNISFTLSFDQVTWKSTEGLKVRLTDSGKTVYLLLYKGERYVYHKFAIYRLILRDSWPGKRKHILKMYITTIVSRVSRLTKLTFTSRKVFTT